jgi:hypothetical protein
MGHGIIVKIDIFPPKLLNVIRNIIILKNELACVEK